MQFPQLQAWNIYTHAGNYFSKLLLITASQRETLQDTLIVVSEKNHLKKYLSLAEALHIKLSVLEKLQDIDDMGSGNYEPSLWIIEAWELERKIPEKYKEYGLTLEVWKKYSMDKIIVELVELGYEYGEYDTPGSYKKLWDTIRLYRENSEPTHLRFWADELEEIEIREIKIPTLILYSRKEVDIESEHPHMKYVALEEILSSKSLLHIIGDTLSSWKREEYFSIFPQYSSIDILGEYNTERNTIKLPYNRPYCKSLEDLQKMLKQSVENYHIYTKHKKLLSEFLTLNSIEWVTIIGIEHPLTESFSYGIETVLCDDILGTLFVKKRSKKKLSQDIDTLLKIQSGDYVVHIDHGIGVYQWITKKELPGSAWQERILEYLEIHYEWEEKLFVPLSELTRVTKYVGADNPKVYSLKGKSWQKKMTKVKEDIEEVAHELLETFAERKLRSGNRLSYDKEKLETFIASFPYTYTEDQAQAIDDILGDMGSGKNMDRLIVWDVWFWKTELAFIAAYTAVLARKQAVFISPLVVLAHEHFHKALERFLWYGISIWILTRLQSAREVTRTLKMLKDWELDIVIGTHRLLSDDIEYKDLGILIVDEEHKFWVRDKERIKKMRADIDILSLSATPIPRSLNLALSGIRDISLLKTPPVGRKSIETYVARYNVELIKEAGKREFARWGQIFFIHNRVTTLEVYKAQLEQIFPRKKVVITHGQLPWDELEDRIIAFKERKYDILLSTTVVENGIDFSNVNTIFINECQQFGISQIHQLRGRVWRSDEQAYCYLLYKKQELDIESAKRIQTIVDYSYLWAGFELAMKDLEIRWGGDILWVKQSGQGKEIGMSLFLKLLEEKINVLKSWEAQEAILPKLTIDIPLDTYIPEEYFLTESDKLQFYREVESIESIEDIEILEQSMLWEDDENPHTTLKNLFMLSRVKILGRKYMLAQIKKIGQNYSLDFHSWVQLETIKALLALDSEMYLQVVNIEKLRAPVKHFTSDRLFIQYILDILENRWNRARRKIIRKAP